jgi:RimJ/RimL family protein N-acetyltransferase
MAESRRPVNQLLNAHLAPLVRRSHDRDMSPGLDDVAWPLRSLRLTIRRAETSDVESTGQYRLLPSVGLWLTSCPTSQEEYSRQFLDPDRLAKTLVMELNGVVIGDLMLSIEDAWAQTEVKDLARAVQAEVGWCLSPKHEGRGYATEAVNELLRVCFEDLGLRRVKADCFAANEASWRLMERVHMRRELHTVGESLHRSGEWLDGFGYALLVEEWRARQVGQQVVDAAGSGKDRRRHR